MPDPGVPPGSAEARGIATTILAALLGGGGTWLLTWLRQGKKDVIQEYRDIVQALGTKITGLEHQLAEKDQDCYEEVQRVRQEYQVEIDRLRGELAAEELRRERESIRREDTAHANARLRAELRVKEMALNAARSGMGSLEDAVPWTDALVTADERGIVTRASQGTMLLLDWEPEDLVGKPISVLIPHRYREAHEMAWRRAMGGEGPPDPSVARPFHAITKDGREIPVLIHLNVKTDGGRKFCTARMSNRMEAPGEPFGPARPATPLPKPPE